MILLLPFVLSAADSEVAKRFVGSWKLVSWELTDTAGNILYPYGRDAVGRITYDAAHRISIQIMRRGRSNFTSKPFQSTVEEAAAAFKSYFAYQGTYSIDERRGVVIHKVEASLYPNQTGLDQGLDQVRRYTLHGTRLVLEGDTASGHSKLTWEKMPD
jgi:hypothetical protein